MIFSALENSSSLLSPDTELGRQLDAVIDEKGRLEAKKAFLAAWEDVDIPLDTKSGRYCKIIFGVSPVAGVPAKELINDKARGFSAVSFKGIKGTASENIFFLLSSRFFRNGLCDFCRENPLLSYRWFAFD